MMRGLLRAIGLWTMYHPIGQLVAIPSYVAAVGPLSSLDVYRLVESYLFGTAFVALAGGVELLGPWSFGRWASGTALVPIAVYDLALPQIDAEMDAPRAYPRLAAVACLHLGAAALLVSRIARDACRSPIAAHPGTSAGSSRP